MNLVRDPGEHLTTWAHWALADRQMANHFTACLDEWISQSLLTKLTWLTMSKALDKSVLQHVQQLSVSAAVTLCYRTCDHSEDWEHVRLIKTLHVSTHFKLNFIFKCQSAFMNKILTFLCTLKLLWRCYFFGFLSHAVPCVHHLQKNNWGKLDQWEHKPPRETFVLFVFQQCRWHLSESEARKEGTGWTPYFRVGLWGLWGIDFQIFVEIRIIKTWNLKLEIMPCRSHKRKVKCHLNIF